MQSVARFASRYLLAGALAATGLTVAQAAEHVEIGIGKSSSDAPLYVAQEQGFFKDEGLDVNLVVLDSGAKIIAPLSTGQLDAGSGALSVGFYNALGRGVKLRIVSDRGHVAPGYLYQTVFMRKDLIDSGKFKGLKDLKGMRMAYAAPGVTALSLANEAAKKGGIKFEDIIPVYMSFPQQVVAMQNKAIDGSFLIEPQATILVNQGIGVRFMNTNDFYPGQQITVLFYSDKFAKERPVVAQKLARAWLRAVRFYLDALKDGKIAGPNADAVVQTIAKNFHMEPKLVREMYSQAVDPDGKLNVAGIQKDLDFFHERGWVSKSVTLEGVIDMSFVQKAAADLGPYKPKAK